MKPPGMLIRAALLAGPSLVLASPLSATQRSQAAVQESESVKPSLESPVEFRSQPQHLAVVAPHRPRTAHEEEKQADLVVDFRSWEALRIEKPAQHEQGLIGKAELQSSIRAQHIGNTLAVVILSKRLQEAETVDSIATEFHLLGFTRVIVQQAAGYETPEGRAILKDSTASAAVGFSPTGLEANDTKTTAAPAN